MKKIILEYDDFHWKFPENCLDFLELIINKYPVLKISLFTTPIHSFLPLSQNNEWCKRVKKLIESNNIKLAVHGTYHNQEEFKNVSEEKAIDLLLKSEEEFKKSDLPFLKIFRGPHWGINQNTYNALKKLKYTHVYTHENYNNLTNENKDIKNIIYNWNLKDEFSINSQSDIIIAHGHTFDTCSNGLEKTFDKIEKLMQYDLIEYHTIDEI